MPRSRHASAHPNPLLDFFSPLEPRALLAAELVASAGAPASFFDADHDLVTVSLEGPGSARLWLTNSRASDADLHQLSLFATTPDTSLSISVERDPQGFGDGLTTLRTLLAPSLGSLHAPETTITNAVIISGSVSSITLAGLDAGADLAISDLSSLHLGFARGTPTDSAAVFALSRLGPTRVDAGADSLTLVSSGSLDSFDSSGPLARVSLRAVSVGPFTSAGLASAVELRSASSLGMISLPAGATGLNIRAASSLAGLRASDDVSRFAVDAGETGPITLTAGSLRFGSITSSASLASLSVADQIRNLDLTAAGSVGDIRARSISSLRARTGADVASLESSSGVADSVRFVTAGRILRSNLPSADNILLADVPFSESVRIGDSVATADQGPGALLSAQVEQILEQAIARAVQLGVNATISVVDHEGNILGAYRTAIAGLAADPASSTVRGGGLGGLEGVSLPSSIFATTKAGTAAFLSTNGNAFSTRTAAFIIQPNFPPTVREQASGPLFGVQFSSLPTSDVNRLPLGLAADPGGLPLYIDGRAVGGIGVELDGTYSIEVQRSAGTGAATTEELIALAGQTGFEPPAEIRADNILVGGIRFDYANAPNPSLDSLGSLPDLTALAPQLTELSPLRDAPASQFINVTINSVPGNTIASFIDSSGAFAARDGDLNGSEGLTAQDVADALARAQALNLSLRAAIRKDRPQVSRVSVSVVDLNGNLLGVLRSQDAPVFGFDVSTQKARTAAFFSRADAGAKLRAAGFGQYADAAAALGINLDGSIAFSDRAVGFLARPFLPDGISSSSPGPFSALAPEQFSVFNTGIQVDFLTANLLDFAADFAAVGNEAAALQMFDAGLLGGGGAADPALGLASGAQIFAGGIPLYKNGTLVGAIGVSGDGIDQDDYVAFAGAEPLQQFGSVRRADDVTLPGGFRITYIKLPREPFGGF